MSFFMSAVVIDDFSPEPCHIKATLAILRSGSDRTDCDSGGGVLFLEGVDFVVHG